MSKAFEIPFNQAADIVRAAFGNVSSRRTVKVEVRESYQVSDYWDGGSRNEAVFLKLDTMQAIPATAMPGHMRQQQNNPMGLAIAQVNINPGFCVVEHVYFQGHDLGYRIYLHASNITPQLTAAPPTDIDDRDKRILAAYRGLKSGPYRQEALQALNYTDADRDRLAGKGYLKVSSNGATGITVEGRTVCSGTQVF